MKREMGGKVAAGDSGGARTGAGRGFTLVELLVVMGIIAILVSLLFPAITQVMVAVRRAATANVIRNLGVALDVFRNDWGVYPPSDNTHDTMPAADTTDGSYGYYNLFIALTGPERKGWGTNYQNKGPFGGTCTEVKPPYFLPDKAADMQWTDSVQTIHQGYADAFKPGRAIFYFRYEPTETPNPYDVNDNPLSTNGATGPPLLGFASQIHFEMLVTVLNPANPTGPKRWVRDDYLLISCGASRYWGYVKQTKDANGNVTVTPATASDLGVSTCDNVTNFSYSR
ncbi:MAG TPA: type II secretion system protein [Phycisphaerae bacterium]|nr:type II secretion system protein [Phycisphaerae bacterium]